MTLSHANKQENVKIKKNCKKKKFCQKSFVKFVAIKFKFETVVLREHYYII